MKILYLDCFSGISGDMTLGALLDLGIDREVFLKELGKLNLPGFEIKIENKLQKGISGTDVDVILTDVPEHLHEHEHPHPHTQTCKCTLDGEDVNEPEHLHEPEHPHEHDHEHSHGHEHPYGHEHPHGHEHSHDHGHSHEPGMRNIKDIEMIINWSDLDTGIKELSKRIFMEIAQAEARVHGKSIDEVHFHEVGAVDSIVDIVGTAICLKLLGIDAVYSSVLHDGSGFIQCAHGIIPVPVPAVMEMLSGSGIPLVQEDVGTELVTPTGMGIIKTIAKGFGTMPPMTVEKTGFGFGKRETGRLNALRAVIGNDGAKRAVVGADESQKTIQDEIAVLETNIDNATPELLGYVSGLLMDRGALDAFYTPIYMKKNRPAWMLTVLAAKGTEDSLAELVLKETPTLGIRKRYETRYVMDRELVTVKTPIGEARVKLSSFGNIKKAAPEYEDCRKIALEKGLPLAGVYETVLKELDK